MSNKNKKRCQKLRFRSSAVKSAAAQAAIVLFSFLFSACQTSSVQTGLDRISQYQSLFAGKRVGVITNHTAYNQKKEHIVDVFRQMPTVTVNALFSPEHGIEGLAEAGEKIDSESGSTRKIPIYSLYGKNKKPTKAMLENIDVLVFDIQDIGARFYTYIYTMALSMEAAAEEDKQFIVLDRPNPINGVDMEGNLLNPQFSSFVGLYPVPVRHGLTVGELARLFNEEGWLKNGVHADLEVVAMTHWRRAQWYDETGLEFIKPSPNMPDLTTALVYPGICLLEGTNVSEGRGSETPFLLFGAPWLDERKLTQSLNALNLPGVIFHDTTFVPAAIPGVAEHPKYKGQLCRGASLKALNRKIFQPFLTGMHIVDVIHKTYPDSLQWHISHFDRLCGDSIVRETIVNRGDVAAMNQAWQDKLQRFRHIRKKYLLYN